MAILKVQVSSDDHIQGTKNAPIVLVEYGDYQCPYCGMAYPVVKMIQKHFGKQLLFVFRNFPLSEAHPLSEPAAETAEFAAEYDKFWQMHDLLYENQARFSIPFLLELGETLGLSSQALDQTIADRQYEAKIKKDFLSGVRSGVKGAPTFFVNGQRYNGPVEFNEFVSAIESVLVG